MAAAAPPPSWQQRVLQFTLDLFGSEPAPPTPAGPAPAVPVPVPVPVSARPRVRPRAPAPTPLPLPDAALVFRHPQANRELRLHDSLVAYLFQRARRRSIGFVVGPDGLVVRAPRWVPLAEVDAALRDKSAWILRKLGEARERQQRQAAAVVCWGDGAELPFLGAPLRVRLQPEALAAGTLRRLPPDEAQALGVVHVLSLGLPPQAEPGQVRDAVQACLMREARALFVQRLDHYAPQLGVQWKKLGLSQASTRWGSARVDGSIRLNWRLIHFSLPVIDYVVVHELAHLRVMDHSPRFWDTVASVVPDHAQRRQQLRQGGLPPW